MSAGSLSVNEFRKSQPLIGSRPEIVIRPKSKTKQYYGFVGETEYDEEFIKELERDFAESGDI